MFSKRARGVTLIELIVFMAIMGIAAAGIIGVINLSAAASADPLRRKQALMVAEAMMEEIQQARFTLCDPDEANAETAVTIADCTPNGAVVVGARSAGETRPYPNVAQYATALDAQEYSFARTINNTAVDVDVNGSPLGSTGYAALAGIRTTAELKLIAVGAAPQNKLGPPGQQIDATAADLRVLRIVVRSSYGNAPGDVVQLEGYRTRYAPRLLP